MNKHITSAELAYAPRKLLAQRVREGWRLIPGMEYRPDEYAILMHRPEAPEPVNANDVVRVFVRQTFTPQFCSADGCGNIIHATGLCKRHYGQAHRLRYKRPRAAVADSFVRAGW